MKNMPRILIVEDERLVARDLQNVLKLMGFISTEIASSGEEALRRAEEFLPDIVLMDIKLKNKMDGIETAGRIRSRFDIPIIFTSALSDQETMDRTVSIGRIFFLRKPIREDQLWSVIEQAMA